MKISSDGIKFLNDVDVVPNNIYVHHTKIEERLPIHVHTKHQLSYVEGGVAFLNTPTNSYFLPARHFVWVPAGMQHNVELRSPVVMVRNLYFPSDLFPKNHKLRKMGIYPVTNLVMEMIMYTEQWKGGFNEKDIEVYEFLLALRNVLMAVSRVPLPVVLPTTKNESLLLVLRYIHENIEAPLKLNDLAKRFGMSSRSLSRLFRQHIDTSFLQYVKLTRVIKSMEMLLETNMSISEIAYACGYSNVAAFSNVFMQMAKRRPADFRKENIKISH
ncbi:helix-turn-helix domain-containing protein [Zhouia sp. PK063]|uniref:helix-turn-helix domain-containing protein n=1 Tax=Zhouia sp. PK063 TaxID=3373602 RepID=UPI0037A0000C